MALYASPRNDPNAAGQPVPTLAHWTQLIRTEYLEMPGLHLTPAQVRRLWSLDDTTVEGVLTALVAAGFLRCTSSGAYVLAARR